MTIAAIRRALSLRLILLLALLTGCASSAPPPTRYLLPPDGQGAQAGSETEPDATLLLPAPRLAGYLATPGIVLQLDDITLNPAGAHRWAEDLALLLQRGLRARLAQRLPAVRVLADGPREAAQLRIDVDGFHGRHDGVAIASGHWQLRDAQGGMLAERSFRVENELETDGYPALVRALGRSLDGLANEIAAAVGPLLLP